MTFRQQLIQQLLEFFLDSTRIFVHLVSIRMIDISRFGCILQCIGPSLWHSYHLLFHNLQQFHTLVQIHHVHNRLKIRYIKTCCIIQRYISIQSFLAQKTNSITMTIDYLFTYLVFLFLLSRIVFLRCSHNPLFRHRHQSHNVLIQRHTLLHYILI